MTISQNPALDTFEGLFNEAEFVYRHLGSNDAKQADLLSAIGYSDMATFINETVPEPVRLHKELDLPVAMSEHAALAKLRTMADDITVNKSYIGQGYSPVRMPAVIQRNVLENPGWYTAYTPYQAEIAQGRLEALLNFQQVCIDLTGLELAGASLLDEATAAAEAMAMSKRVSKSKSMQFFVDDRVYPQTLDVINTRAKYFGWEVVVGDFELAKSGDYFGALFQYVGVEGDVKDLTDVIAAVKKNKTYVSVVSDIMSLVLLKSPADMGADVALGSTQRFGIPMGFGGPHAAYFAFSDKAKRSAPGRIIGVSKDSQGNTALRMALQTREQHIRREKANSNICTSQVLLANLAGMYAVYHGPGGVKRIATRIHAFATAFADVIKNANDSNLNVLHDQFFDSVVVDCGSEKLASQIFQNADNVGYNLWRLGETKLSVAFSETSDQKDFNVLTQLFVTKAHDLPEDARVSLDSAHLRTDAILSHPVFNSHHTEHEMLRYLKSLEDKDLAMNRSMISLGSCTMKLNATSEMLPITWPEFANVHPFAPRDQVTGYVAMIDSLQEQLKAITGFDDVSMQPNSGASGEYAGLLAIRRYHESLGETDRDVCLIPMSAHGTNPATAMMMGMKVVVVKTDDNGNVDIDDLTAKSEEHSTRLGALMITYPSTHGVFEEGIRKICDLIHKHGGQVYMDGANMNAQVGMMQPADVGADVLHMNLHKTFCIPHGGGGPGMGPIGMKAHLAPFMANHTLSPVHNAQKDCSAVSAAPYGSASILPISWMYIAMMGRDGLLKATELALLNANYVAAELKDHYPVLYTGKNGRVAHECIIDIRPLKEETGISESDIAKRLMDYGFHSPTMSFPVAGTLMIEPTESESKEELDRFISALKSIKAEALKAKAGEDNWTLENNPLVNAPHTAAMVIDGEWTYPYSRETAAFPLPYIRTNKFWPSVARVDDAYGDKNLMCSCPSIENYM
ncbi:aminomethyl-transferring glycine dehydrogenase [Psychrobacter cryohalolentis]|uniref:Glycine dehydrogenase (decarboxylating) n=1 Tax=Psychrobacter cryohalolentis (strain ATCC BAA-1226 / DSM 17306 / VKM B-2378 / K5) TaxID=335284 RepID=GCSP_PSYCK|nr:aminomethyl-transferring glycine dehydrogenase [Psychrobacter cryohalolentis]Q1QCL7.1 RecName: Full=Glycine dehydrogenase (decarboxylating); AltName: Full=Glycine cleavage system P-protein; AltName: Full=Glycine decarboxylase; AltName: Full=Glycine dehydrogenase (aminomethyl-transferring) [Psychrobacter cryohalolentis K5]ABE74586.1 glycine dehydrogenase (decarboxylating) beta subunit / glycine dehydrogenase (decarboxylating) alpha subunit [Psychrobacter cryohalolentis K5]ASE27206.1 glycine de